MELLDELAQLNDISPKIRQFLVESSQRVADPQLREQLTKIVAGLDENLAIVQQTLPGLVENLTARKANAEARIRDNISKLQTVHDNLTAHAQAVKASAGERASRRRPLEVEEPEPNIVAAEFDAPDMGRRLREGLMRRYVWGAVPPREVAPPKSFEDWTDSVVQLEMPVIQAPAAERTPPPRSFDSWLDGTMNQSDASEPEAPKKSDDEARKLDQDFLKYMRKEDR